MAVHLRHLSSPSVVRSIAKYSTKDRQSYFNARPLGVLRLIASSRHRGRSPNPLTQEWRANRSKSPVRIAACTAAPEPIAASSSVPLCRVTSLPLSLQAYCRGRCCCCCGGRGCCCCCGCCWQVDYKVQSIFIALPCLSFSLSSSPRLPLCLFG